MIEVNNLKHFSLYINQVFPGALFLVCSDAEFKRLMLDLTHALLQDKNRRNVHSAQVVGRNVSSDGFEAWVMSPIGHLGQNFRHPNHPCTSSSKLACDSSSLIYLKLTCHEDHTNSQDREIIDKVSTDDLVQYSRSIEA